MISTPSTLFSLESKTAVLTGASGFLGRTFAEALLTQGARVIAIGRSDRLHDEARKWADRFGSDRVRALQVDMYDLKKYGETLDEIAAEEKRIDILINNAHELGPATGLNTPDGTLEDGTFDQWTRNLTGGVYWSVLSTQRIGKRMVARAPARLSISRRCTHWSRPIRNSTREQNSGTRPVTPPRRRDC